MSFARITSRVAGFNMIQSLLTASTIGNIRCVCSDKLKKLESLETLRQSMSRYQQLPDDIEQDLPRKLSEETLKTNEILLVFVVEE